MNRFCQLASRKPFRHYHVRQQQIDLRPIRLTASAHPWPTRRVAIPAISLRNSQSAEPISTKATAVLGAIEIDP